MTSAGAMGGGVSSAIARALGAGNAAAARQLVVHALVIAAAMGVGFTVIDSRSWVPAIYGLLGGRGETLGHALRLLEHRVRRRDRGLDREHALQRAARQRQHAYAGICADRRGAGARAALARTLVARIGIAGAGIAYVTTFGIAALVMAAIVFRRTSALRPHREDWTARMAQVPRDPARRRDLVAERAADRGHGGDHHRLRRALRRRRARRLRRGPAPGAAADSARVRRRAGAGGAGRHAHRRRRARSAPSRSPGPAPALAACDQPRDRHHGCDFSARLGGTLQRRRRGAGERLAATCARWRRSTLSSPPASRSTSPRRAPDACCGRCSPARCASSLVIAGGLMAVSLQGVFIVIAAAMIAFGALTMWFVASAKWK